MAIHPLANIFMPIQVCIEVIIIVFCLYCSKFVYLRFKERKSLASRNLLILFLTAIMTAGFSMIDALLYPNFYSVLYGYGIVLVATALQNTALLYFATEIFFTERELSSKLKHLRRAFFIAEVSVTSIAAILIFTGIELTNPVLLTFNVMHMLLTFPMVSILIKRAYKLAKQVKEEEFKHSIRYIGHFAVSMIFIYISVIVDAISPRLGPTGVVLLVIFLISIHLSYLGFVKPIKIQLQNRK